MSRTWSVVAGLLLAASAVLVVGAALDWWTLSFQIGSRVVGDGVVSLLLAGVSVAIALVIVLDLWDLQKEDSPNLLSDRFTTHLPADAAEANLLRPTLTTTEQELDWPALPDPLGADVSVPFGHPPAESAEPVIEPAVEIAAHTPAAVLEPAGPEPVPAEVETRLVVDLTDGPAPAHLLLEGGAGVIDLSSYSDEEIITSIAAGEAQVVDLLLTAGYLTTDGPLTDDDTAVLVFVAVTTGELVAVLTGHGYLADDGQITDRLDEARRFQAQPALRG